jgi:hypothetical protein
MQHSFVRERDSLRITEHLAITPQIFSFILSKLSVLERDRVDAETDRYVASNERAFVDFDFASIEPETGSNIELDMKMVYNR